jgi:hypothetical protein
VPAALTSAQSGRASPPQVRTRLHAGERWIRTFGSRSPKPLLEGPVIMGEGTGCSNTRADLWGTEGSNPLPSSGESGTNRTPSLQGRRSIHQLDRYRRDIRRLGRQRRYGFDCDVRGMIMPGIESRARAWDDRDHDDPQRAGASAGADQPGERYNWWIYLLALSAKCDLLHTYWNF